MFVVSQFSKEKKRWVLGKFYRLFFFSCTFPTSASAIGSPNLGLGLNGRSTNLEVSSVTQQVKKISGVVKDLKR